MRFPLIVAARPSEGISYPHVTLRAGVWRFSSNHVESLLRVNTPDQSVELHEELNLTSPTKVFLTCEKAGKEQSITVYACR